MTPEQKIIELETENKRLREEWLDAEAELSKQRILIREFKLAARMGLDALNVAFDYDYGDVFGIQHNDAVDATIELERVLEKMK